MRRNSFSVRFRIFVILSIPGRPFRVKALKEPGKYSGVVALVAIPAEREKFKQELAADIFVAGVMAVGRFLNAAAFA